MSAVAAPAAIPPTPTPASPFDAPSLAVAAPVSHIATAPRRNNVLHDYEEGFEDLSAIVCLMDGGKYMVLDEDDWQDYPLKLAVHDSERTGWLVIVYANGNVIRVPVETLHERVRRKAYSRYAATPILFASIATAYDTLARCVTDDKGRQYMRLDDIDFLPEGSMRDEGDPLTDQSIVDVLQCDILSTASIPGELPRNFPRRQRGAHVMSENGARMKELMR